MVNIENLVAALAGYHGKQPFDYCIVDNFFSSDVAAQLEAEFPSYDSPKWYIYDNAIENKRALNDWNQYQVATYQTLAYLLSETFVRGVIGRKLGLDLRSDPGLHGGGWHMHGQGGNLNPHMDYHFHPKLQMVRKLNLIVYLSSSLEPDKHGGHLGLWEHDEDGNCPGKLVHEIAPQFNRAVLFDTTQNSWHGMSRQLDVPDGVYRKSLAIYYLISAEPDDFLKRQRALFAPRGNQADDPDVAKLIRARVDSELYKTAYIKPVLSRNK